jgi:uncharacterized protein
MIITFDPAKRDKTLVERGLDFNAAPRVFSGEIHEKPDERFDYGESRIITVGYLDGRMVVIVWTQRGDSRHIISMRHANGRERKAYAQYLG